MVEVICERRLRHAVVAITGVQFPVRGVGREEVEGSGVDYQPFVNISLVFYGWEGGMHGGPVELELALLVLEKLGCCGWEKRL